MTFAKHIHPFPARMAPEIALDACNEVAPGAVVLDPMCGSGTVLGAAVDRGLFALGYDLDPLAVLIARVFCTPLDGQLFFAYAEQLVLKARSLTPGNLQLPNIDGDKATKEFVDFWFAPSQQADLRRLSWLIGLDKSSFRFALRVALSRLVITKEPQASLARDTSHSRPHRVKLDNDYDVMAGFLKSSRKLACIQGSREITGCAAVRPGDARALGGVKSNTVDLIVTSPPYLNALDYMRGHKLSLVWLGYKLDQLRSVRSNAIGAEKKLSVRYDSGLRALATAGSDPSSLAPRENAMVLRYARDIQFFTRRCERVLKPGGKAVFVVGNSCLRGKPVRNADIVEAAATSAGLLMKEVVERDLPDNRRYLPPPAGTTSSLEKRMRTEAVMMFVKR